MEPIFLGNSPVIRNQHAVEGGFVVLEGEKYYKISNYHQIPDFLINIVSDTDSWMFISSNGSLAAGRKDRDNALFPYYTDDKIHDYQGKTGSRSYFLVNKDGKTFLWEPFTAAALRLYQIRRNIYKNLTGNKILFEEINETLGLTFKYGWYHSERFGFVKRSSLSNEAGSPVSVELLDGLLNIVPAGVGYAFQNEYSNLSNAYKRSEKAEDSPLGLFMLNAIPVDRVEPSESLLATTVWTTGLEGDLRILLSEKQTVRFLNGEEVLPEQDIRAERGAYLVQTRIHLAPGERKEWFTVANINQDHTDIVALKELICSTRNLTDLIEADIEKGTRNLRRMVSMADGFQVSNTEICYARHYTNTLFNIMRGGLFIHDYEVEKKDYTLYLWEINRLLSKEFQSWIEGLPDKIDYRALQQQALDTGHPDLIRITSEYLPLTFSRRHGDPSRPWNRFSIETRNQDGSVKYYYEGNWRDIFQNWEALCYSFPEYIEGIIAKFVNASTIDGYNPYRIMRDGIDWEVLDPHDAWSYIGYWGDHQIIYLQKLLELSSDFHPGKLENILNSEIYTYANVPYRIKSLEDILADPKNTVIFDAELDRRIKTEASFLGADACMLKDKRNQHTYKVNLTEKVLVSLLSKFSNFIPEAGIWLNTQRPEWNDANNALVGNGASMVTLYYLRRFMVFWIRKFSSLPYSRVSLSVEVATLLERIHHYLEAQQGLLDGRFSDADRLDFANNLGKAHDKYRSEVYTYSFSGEKQQLEIASLVAFLKLSLAYIDHSIRVNKREDGLYHTYNLIAVKPQGIAIRPLYEMLEGQVAVLSSGYLSSEAALELLKALKHSAMFREDQYSYLLYPDREIPGFLEKNCIPTELVASSVLLERLVADGDRSILTQDIQGDYHFHHSFRNAQVLEQALNDLKVGSNSQLVDAEREKILGIYEKVFDHQSFTGRSGTFFGYEGLGSIYWHMVSKLLLATQECFFKAVSEGAGASITGQLKDFYYEIKAGIGLYKNPAVYGAFPTDAHSHTPAGSGAKQPGLTGQVKEDVIARLGELALSVKEGQIVFDPALVNEGEILEKATVFEYYTSKGEKKTIHLDAGEMAFTFCLVPVILRFADQSQVVVHYADGRKESTAGHRIRGDVSQLIFQRNGEIDKMEVSFAMNRTKAKGESGISSKKA